MGLEAYVSPKGSRRPVDRRWVSDAAPLHMGDCFQMVLILCFASDHYTTGPFTITFPQEQ